MPSLLKTLSWRFSEEQLLWERHHYYKAINKQFLNQLINCSRDDDHEQKNKIINLAKHLDIASSTPEMFSYVLEKKVSKDNLTNAIELLENANSSTNKPLKFRGEFNQHIPWIHDSIQRIVQSFDAEHQSKMQITLGTEFEQQAKALIIEAIELLEQLSPGAYQEVKHIFKECILLSGQGLKSSSVPTSFGAIYLLINKEWNLVNYLDFIIHEVAHHSLVIKTALIKVVNNPSELAKSPLRPDLRPISGILHATFVLVRVCYILLQYIKNNGEYSESARVYIQNYTSSLEEGLLTLNKAADWTKEGRKLYEDIYVGLKEIKDEMGRLGVRV